MMFVLLVICGLPLFFVPRLWPVRRLLVIVAAFVIVFCSVSILMTSTNVFSVLVGIVGLYRVFNLLRVVEERMHDIYLRRSTARTEIVLVGVQLALMLAGFAWGKLEPSASVVWTVLAAAQLAGAAILLSSTVRRLNKTRWPAKVAKLNSEKLPTLTVAIPARNETEDLQACLETIIPCDYPKLEILVLDDCSQNKRTPEIIRSYAHDGVRFVQGDEPSDIWLPKNQAYNKLVKEASGEYILFCGVDLRFEKDSISQVISLMLSKKKQMVSILPWRGDEVSKHSAITQAMRYFWELVPPRRLFERPPVLSSCWVIQKKTLQKVGGFRAVARSIVPEAYFAKQLLPSDGYSFMRAGRSAGIASLKSSEAQHETAVRTRYPQLHRRPENVLLLSLANLGMGFLPFVVAATGFWFNAGWPAVAMSALAAVLLTATYIIMATGTRTSSWLFGLVGMPVGVVYDLWLLHYSMYRYEFSTVEWKDRNICIPAMHVYPHLPPLGDKPQE